MISQLTVFLENEKGRLAAACRTVSEAGINMHALNVADTADFGVVRMLTCLLYTSRSWDSCWTRRLIAY